MASHPVLTEESDVTCGHGPGKVGTSGFDKLQVGGYPVLLKSGIEGQDISDCGTENKSDNSGPTDAKCKKVEQAQGESTKLKAGGNYVMLSTLAGKTNGMVGKVTPQTLLKANDAKQDKLKAE